MKRPSELGFRIPANVENAIMKALAVKTEDRFPNMEAFIGALNGRVSVQDQVAASISQRTQATAYRQEGYGQIAYQQPAYNGGGAAAGKPSAFSRFLSYMKANPVVAWVSGGGLLAVIALCIILPIALSGGGEKRPTGGGGGGNTPVISQPTPVISQPQTSNPEPTTDPEPTTEPPAEMVAQDLGILNATIEIPSDYTRVEEETIFINEAKGCGMMMDYLWNIDGPIYSLADVESQREAIAANLMQNLFEVSDYQILAAGPDQVGSAGAYQIYLEGTDSEGVSNEVVIMAVEGYDFGCYFIITSYPKGDKAAEAEIHSIIQSFESNGAPETTYKMYYGSKSGVKVIVDDAVAAGRVMDTTVNLGEAGAAAELVIYPTDAAMEAGFGSATPDSGIVEIGNAGQLGMSSPEEVLQFQRDVASSAGVSVGETYTSQSGGVEWLCMDWTMNEFTFSVASAMIDGKCYAVAACSTAPTKMRLSLCINRPWRPSVHGRDNQHGRSYSNSRSERIGLCHASGFRLAVLQEERKTTEKKRACTAECRAAIVDVGNYHARNKHRMSESRRGCFRGALSERSGRHGKAGGLPRGEDGDAGTLLLSRVPVYLPGRDYEQIGNVPAMEEQARKKVGTELTLFIDPAKPTSFYCLEEEKGYFPAAPCLPDRRSSRHMRF